MLTKPVLHYFNGRGRAEIVRLTLASVGIEWTEVHLNEASDFKKLKNGKTLI
jgi:glutathione S-transferase